MKGLIILVTLLVSCDCTFRRSTLRLRSNIYLPSSYLPGGEPEYTLDGDSVEQFSYDVTNKVAYVAGGSLIHAVSFSDPDDPGIMNYIEADSGMKFTDIKYCNGFLFATYDNTVERPKGGYVVYNDILNGFDKLYSREVGVLPDSIEATSDCSKLVIAVEGEPYDEGGVFTDPLGLVHIVEFTGDPADEVNSISVTRDFTMFNDQVDTLSDSGARFVYRENGNTFAQDIEPEYVTISDDDKYAYISLQENNAVATVDIETKTILSVKGLGFKDMSTLKMDPSNEDKGTFLDSYNVFGMYQPDGIAYLRRVGSGHELLFTANEGDSKDYDEYSEEERGAKIDTSIYPSDLDAVTADQLGRESLLGRLELSVSPAAKESDGTLKALYMFGARSFSIRNATTMERLYDSGDDFEVIIDYLKRDVFNSDFDEPDDRPFENVDRRSDDKSFEPNAVAVREFGQRMLVAVLLERPGGIMLYGQDSPGDPVEFQDMFFGIPDTRGKTWQELYNDRELSVVKPEDARFLTRSESPSGRRSLMVAATISGTLSLFDVRTRFDNLRMRRALTCARNNPPWSFTGVVP